MTSRNILMAAVLAFAGLGCAGEEITEPPGREAPHVERCDERRLICTGDTICMEPSCQGAFDRDYQVRLNVSLPGGKRECPNELDCPIPLVEVFHDDGQDPIISSADPRLAEIFVTPDSSLIAEHGGDQCVIELTTERLQIGQGTCWVGGLSVTLMLRPMPREGDDEAALPE